MSLHLQLVVLMGVLIRVAPRGAADATPSREAGLVLVSSSSGEVVYLSETANSVAPSPSSSSPTAQDAIQAALPQPTAPPLDLAGALPAAAPPAVDGQLVGAPSIAQSVANRPAGGGLRRDYGVETQVFGITGKGSRFVYVFDRSASMDGFEGRPLRASKDQLIQSLASLGKTHQFQIVFYNDRRQVFHPNPAQPPTLMFADEQTKRLATGFVRGIIASGGTRHMDALRLALSMNPDVVFFLTDAAEHDLTGDELDEIARRNAGIGASINTIEFGAGPPTTDNSFLVRLARTNHGRHVYVDVRRLGPATNLR